MAWVCYVACDNCGAEGAYWVNDNVHLSHAIYVARKKGWQVGKTGWLCPKCRTRKRGSKSGKDKR